MSKNGFKEAKRIAKEIGGHIPERVVGEHIPNDEEILTPNRAEKYIAISLEKYERLIKEIGYYKGKTEALEELIKKIR